MGKNIIVVKIGGSTLGSNDTTIKDLVAIQNQHISVVVVHGGAKIASEWLAKLNVQTSFINGLRVTSKDSLGVVTAVYAGLVNKELVAAIQGAEGKAVGLSGSDGNLLFAKIKSPELGYVGEITKVNTNILDLLLNAGYIPVVAPISFGSIDGTATLLNVNGDTVAAEIAAALSAERLIFLTDVDGIHDKSGKLLPKLSLNEARDLISSGTATGGMIPKIEACLRASITVPIFHIINGRNSHALLHGLDNQAGGTRIE